MAEPIRIFVSDANDTLYEAVQVGWQFIDDGIGDGGLTSLDTSLESFTRGDTRWKPIYRLDLHNDGTPGGS